MSLKKKVNALWNKFFLKTNILQTSAERNLRRGRQPEMHLSSSYRLSFFEILKSRKEDLTNKLLNRISNVQKIFKKVYLYILFL